MSNGAECGVALVPPMNPPPNWPHRRPAHATRPPGACRVRPRTCRPTCTSLATTPVGVRIRLTDGE